MTETMADWITEGAEVVVAYAAPGHGTTNVKRSTITRVTRTQFAVDGVDQRFNRRTKETAHEAYSGYYAAYPADSDIAKRLLRGWAKAKIKSRATKAAKAYWESPTRERRKALMSALEKMEGYRDI